ncbi:divalent-cation tolerance protein CutA [Aquabacterium sp. J223]|uniref:divalent-cation tolerance protein CutA n=1 Tax=Aquabacterium sp. J223 TaxID=2898431 RepID=UPI0021ADAF0B|nr:divalent-cation tolerance protein CutA [Aquabacterium sp. J223]UUX97159.1 divalent-cation tolerance protein CutA [Aquabacterium sp. J223]
MPEPLVALFTTVGSEVDARRLAALLVERRLAACVQVSAIESVYRWQGAVQQDREWRLLAKTPEACRDAALTAWREAHPYDLPALWWQPVDAEPRYAGWVADETAPPRRP